MYCWKCGAENEDSAQFCWKCGMGLLENEVRNSRDRQQNQANKRRLLVRVGIIVGICLFIVISGGVSVLWYSEEQTSYGMNDMRNEESQLMVDQIDEQWNELDDAILAYEYIEYSEGRRTDYYDKQGNVLCIMLQSVDGFTTFMPDKTGNIVSVLVMDIEANGSYYYYENEQLIGYKDQFSDCFDGFEDTILDRGKEYQETGRDLLEDLLIWHRAEESSVKAEEYILPSSSERMLSDDEVEMLTKEQLRLARNEIYARHGRKFKDAELQNYFDSKSWYVGTIDPDDFAESMLTHIEKANIEVIQKYEKR